MGSARQDDQLCRRFAETLGIDVAAVKYRWAPEHPYPAALDDCTSGLHWLLAQPGVDSTRVAIGGASAGGGLAAALAHRLRGEATINPVLQLLVYPMLDDRTAGRPGVAYLGWNVASNSFGWRSYLGATDPGGAVLARCAEMDGLAPAWLGVGTLDLFCDEVRAYARRLESSGVGCTLEMVHGAFHEFDVTAPRTTVAERFFDSQCRRLREAYEAAGS